MENTRRDFLKKLAYTVPLVTTVGVRAAYARDAYGGRKCDRPPSRRRRR